jgi:hypothetical protein
MPAGSNAKRERQYEHIKEGLVDRGRPEKTAEEIAARMGINVEDSSKMAKAQLRKAVDGDSRSTGDRWSTT